MGSRSEVPAPKFLQLAADPVRWQLLAELSRSDRRVGELTDLLDKPQSLVSYHLGTLRSAGIVTARKSSADGRDTYYRVDLPRCGELLGAAGAALHPGLQLVPSAPPKVPLGKDRAPVVLFLCTGNSARSQMAEALLEHRSQGAIRARSAGSHPKPLHPNAVRVMADKGMDISGRASKHLSRFKRSHFDQVITLCDKVKEICPEFPGQPASAHWSIADPASAADTDDGSYQAFARVGEELEVRISFLIARLSADRQERRNPHAK